jgi:hypothetical protein
MKCKIEIFALFILTLNSCNQQVKFDSEKWKNSGGENITLDTRLNMTKDLIESQILINRSEIEIIELLNFPTRLRGNKVDNTKYFAVQEVYAWDIDPEKMIFIKILFNDEGKSSSADLYSIK